MNGFLLIDKEKGINSFKLVVILRKLAAQKRIGFAGTLDPLATGLMILALGEYTKLLPYLEAKDKVYRVVLEMGMVSDSYDADGKISAYPDPRKPDAQEIIDTLQKNFSGTIKQRPPLFSAIQIDGKRAYDLARKGHQFELKERDVQIFYTKLINYNYPQLELEVHCSSGTYIRSLAHDLGQKLGCGALVKELRRTKIGSLSIDSAFPMEKLKNSALSNFFVHPGVLFADIFTNRLIELDQAEYQVLARGNFIDNKIGWKIGDIGLAFLKDQVVGVLETTEEASKLKFKKKLHIF